MIESSILDLDDDNANPIMNDIYFCHSNRGLIAPGAPRFLITEDGKYLLAENGEYLITES